MINVENSCAASYFFYGDHNTFFQDSLINKKNLKNNIYLKKKNS